MFGLGWDQIIIILLVGIFLLGPERIPTAVQWVGSTVRKLRTMAAGAQAQLRTEIGPELDELRRQIAELQSFKEIQELRDLKDLSPRKLIGRNILGDDFKGGMSGLLGLGPDMSPLTATGSGVAPPVAEAMAAPPDRTAESSGEESTHGSANGSAPAWSPDLVKHEPEAPDARESAGSTPVAFGTSTPPPFDPDAT